MTTNLNIHVADARGAGDALRAIAVEHGYIAMSGPRVGEGSASEVIGALIKGELATVLLGDEERAWAIGWLNSVVVNNPLYGDVPRLIAEQLMSAVRRERADDMEFDRDA